MQGVEHYKFTIKKLSHNREIAIYIWRAPGSVTINARIKWASGEWGNTITDRFQPSTTHLVNWAITRFNLDTAREQYSGYQRVA